MRAPSLHKRVLAVLAAMVLALAAVAAPALADEGQEPTAILYKDGALVFQLGDEADPARGDVVATYTGFDTAEYGNTDRPPWYGRRASIKSVVVEDAFAPVSTAWWFYGCENLASADLSGLDTSNVTDMNTMFDGCKSLASVDLSGLDTSNVTDMGAMFNGCKSLAPLDLSPLETSKVESMNSMFCDCSSLASLDLSPLDTSSVTDMGAMFCDCTSLASLDLSPLDTSSVTIMSGMFNGCSSLSSLDLSPLETSSATDMSWMFRGCSSLASLDLSPFGTSKVENMDSMFQGCSTLASLDLSSFDTSKVENMGDMFSGCSTLASLDLSSFDTTKVENMGDMFNGCTSLSSLALGEGFAFKVYAEDFGGGTSYRRAGLPNPPSATTTGKWVRDGSEDACTSYELMSDNGGSPAPGVYRWQVANPGYASIAGATVTAPDQAYTGSALRPLPTVTLDGAVLRRGTDYGMAVYADNVGPGTATVTVTGMGAYNGTASGTFQIVDGVPIASATVTAPDQAYTGSALRPAPTVELGDETLAAGTDYTVRYKDNIKVGTATVTVTGKGIYTGTATGTFRIGASIASATVTVAAQTYTGKALEPAPTVTLDGKTLVKGTDYAASYKGNTSAGTATVTVTGKGNYTGTASGTFAIAPASLAKATVTAPDQSYTGEALTPAPTVKLGGKTLKAGTDYAASYSNNTNAGTATVTVTGKGNYAGTAKGTFQITAAPDPEPDPDPEPEPEPASIAGATVTVADQAYTGKALTPAPKVVLGGKTLKASTDYTVSYKDNTNVGTATVTVTGKGDYTGTAKGTFKITAAPGPEPASIASATVTAADQAYTGKALTPAPTVTLDGKTLVAGTDYTVSYSNNTEVGTATVTVTGEGNYTGTATGTFEITAAPDPEPDPEPVDRAWTRLAGSDRFGTMQAITLEGYDKADTVLVATGIDFADALAAAGLSGVLKAPIVTTMPGFLSDEAKAAIQALGAKEAIILGGESAVSADVEKQLEAMGLTTSRIAGDNRIDTAVRIWKKGGDAWGDTCILSKGWVAADALAAGSFAYADAAPLFLALPDGTLTPETAAAVASFDHVVVLGGTGGDAAIKDATAKSLGTSWMRVAGDTRYETATALATWASGNDAKAAFQPAVKLSWQDAAVAFAWNYPDALVGVNATGPAQSVTLLGSTDPDEFTQSAADAVAQHADEVSHGYVLGGTSVISDAVKALFEEAAK